MNSALASFLGLVFTAIALYGFYWVIRLAVRDAILEADRKRARGEGPAGPADPADPVLPPAVPAERQPAE